MNAPEPNASPSTSSRSKSEVEIWHKNWRMLFDKLDKDKTGGIGARQLKLAVETAGEESGITEKQRERLIKHIHSDRDDKIYYEEFCHLMAKATKMRLKQVMFRAAQVVVPRSKRPDKLTYLQQYRCWPPPVFMVTISLVEMAVYIYYVVQLDSKVKLDGPVPTNSPLIYNHCKRAQAWRFLTYAFIHIGILHVLFNVLSQLMLGVPLELVHQWRIGVVYSLGVIAGSLASSVTDPHYYLAGASGGVYALMAAHAANLVVNWQEMEFAVLRLAAVSIIICIDGAMALYKRYGDSKKENVSYVAHLGGFVAGLLMGIVVLRNLKWTPYEKLIWWLSLASFVLLSVVCIVWNIAYHPASEMKMCHIE